MTRRALLADLRRSGLTPRDATKLGLQVLTPTQTRMRTPFQVPAYLIPYRDLRGKKTSFYRIRYLAEVKRFGEDKPEKYHQPANTLPRAYLPPLALGATTWADLAANAAAPLLITEGEKKAAKACKSNLPCVGLGGVWSWRALKQGVAFLDDLEAFNWADRPVTLCFDSDGSSNPLVLGALHALARELDARGAVVHLLILPPADDGAKQGLDDLLAARGKAAFYELEPEPYAEKAPLWQLNQEVALIRDLGGIYHLETRQVLSKTTFVEVLFADRVLKRINAKGELDNVNAAGAWLRWERRREHARLDYVPGQSLVLADGALNLWRGWGVTPAAGDVGPFAALLDYVFAGADAERAWFERWLAYPLQHPGAKLYQAVLLLSLAQGTGKSLLGYTLGRIYGDNFAVVSQEELHADFNAWARYKQFALGEELTGTDRRRDADKLKHLITREHVTINAKYQPTYTLPDRLNYLMTSNHPDALFLEQTDRRFFVHEITERPLSQRFYDRYHRWLGRDGPAALFHWLLTAVDVSDFNPRAPAPFTQAKGEMTDLAASDLDLWARALREDPDAVLRLDGHAVRRDLWTVEELLALADPEGQRRTTKIALSKALRRAGLRQLPVTRTAAGAKRLWAVRRAERWHRANHDERVRHYDAADAPAKTGGKVTPLQRAKY